jgi:acetyl esterase/lipase
VEIVAPEEAGTGRAGLVWCHAGGFVLADAAFDLPWLATWVRELGIVAVSVDYRRAPEAPFPAAVEDAGAAAGWFAGAAEDWGVDAGRIAIGGRSAGAAVAGGAVLRAREGGGPDFAFQLYDTPVTDDRLGSESALAYTDTPGWDRRNAALSWEYYLGGWASSGGPASSGGLVPEAAAPGRASDLSGLAPAFVSVAQYDPLRDEGIEFARRLAQAGVPTELHMYPGTFHGSADAVPDAAVSRRQLADLRDAFARGLGLAGGGGP